MNAVEIEEAISKLAEEPFDAAEFPFRFLEAFGNPPTTIKRLREIGTRSTNKSDVEGGVLQRNNIHIAVCAPGEVGETLKALKASPAAAKGKAKFALATDGDMLEVEELATGDAVSCQFADLPKHFGLLLPLAGISTVRQIKDNPIDIRATNRLNKLYVELLKENPDWESDERRADINQFMARLIFCFFAEDTGIFIGDDLFTTAIATFSESNSSNTHEVIQELFRAMDTKIEDRAKAKIRPFADSFPYVNGGLFTKRNKVPKFSRIARSYLLNAGSLNWKEINPDIFGSMIQAVADKDERGDLGMHYTSVPNILKVLNPLFLDDLRENLEEAGDNKRKLLNLRKRLSRIRVFDPACGSGNFLVIAYRQMREIERRIIIRLQGGSGADDELLDIVRFYGDRSVIPLTNFYGIEIKNFAAEIARLALLIAEFQSDVNYIGQKEARDMVLPLHDTGRIKHDNALRANWLEVCPPPKAANSVEEDLGGPTGRLALESAPDAEGETYICGNPPFKGARKQSIAQKGDLEYVFGEGNDHKDCDYVIGWYLQASEFTKACPADFAFVSTNSISRGEQVQHLWLRLYSSGHSIYFCHTQFKWDNNAKKNAGVWCVIIGVTRDKTKRKRIFEDGTQRIVNSISPYLIPGGEDFIRKATAPLSVDMPRLLSGNMPRDDGGLILQEEERKTIASEHPASGPLLRRMIGTTEIKQSTHRWCIWIEDVNLPVAENIPPIKARIDHVRKFRLASKAKTTRGYAKSPHKFAQRCHQESCSIVMPKNTVEGIPYLTPVFVDQWTITTDLAFVIFTEQLWCLAVLSSNLQRIWAEAISGGLGSGVRYSSEITYNSYPLPRLTDNQKIELTRCAEDILLAREVHFPATIAELYDPKKMPDNLRAAHDKNDETLERIYIGRRFKNDTERLEKLFDMYTKMTAKADAEAKGKPKRGKAKKSA